MHADSVELPDHLEPSAEGRLPSAVAHLAVDLALGEVRVDRDMQHLVSHRRQSAAATNPGNGDDPLTYPLELAAEGPLAPHAGVDWRTSSAPTYQLLDSSVSKRIELRLSLAVLSRTFGASG